MTKTIVNKDMDIKLINMMRDTLLWEYQGCVHDGEGDTFKANMRTYLDEMLLNAYKIGYLKNEQTKEVMEAKHIKFLGNKALDEIKDMAVLMANLVIK